MIEFENVSFHYEDSTENVLDHINLDVEAGDYMALVGPSGVGKTTICSLIPRFYEVSEGAIRIDGIDIRDMKLDDLRNNIGIVQQDVYLFAGTIMENIRYGKPDATDEEVVMAARNANAHEFIMSFPEGYDTDIGQRGVKLSTIRNAKRILVLTENGIEEEGTHEQLLEKDGVYADLYQMQFRKGIEC